VSVNVEKNLFADGPDYPLNDSSEDFYSMSVERLDDAVAAIAFTATVITIGIGFLFNLQD
jgi:hypothetical protein